MNLKRCLLACTLAIPAQGWCDALFINDATVHTMGPRTVLQDTDILVRDGRVHSLGIDLEPPIDAVVIEADGRPVTPGTDLLIQGFLGTQMVRELAELYGIKVGKVDTDLLLKLVQKHVGRAHTLVLAVAGNALKAFPGVGTLAGLPVT